MHCLRFCHHVTAADYVLKLQRQDTIFVISSDLPEGVLLKSSLLIFITICKSKYMGTSHRVRRRLGDSFEKSGASERASEREPGLTCRTYPGFFEMIALVNQSSVQLVVSLLPLIYLLTKSPFETGLQVTYEETEAQKVDYVRLIRNTCHKPQGPECDPWNTSPSSPQKNVVWCGPHSGSRGRWS